MDSFQERPGLGRPARRNGSIRSSLLGLSRHAYTVLASTLVDPAAWLELDRVRRRTRLVAMAARAARKRGDWFGAEKLFAELCTLQSDNPEWHLRHAEAMARTGLAQEAADSLEGIAWMQVRHLAPALSLVKALTDAGAHHAAERIAVAVISFAGPTADVLVARGRVAQSKGDFAAALSAFLAARSADPDHDGALRSLTAARARTLRRAEAMIHRGQLGRASDLLKTHLVADPQASGVAEAWLSVQSNFGELRDRALAIAALSDLGLAEEPEEVRVDAEPETVTVPRFSLEVEAAANAVRQKAQSLFNNGKFDEARAVLEPQTTQSIPVLLLHARCSERLQDWKSAVESYARAAALDPQRQDIAILIGNALASSGDTEASRQHFRDAAARFPTNVAIWTQLGRAEARAGYHEDSRTAFEKALALNPPGTAQAWTGLARALGALQDSENAIEAWRRAAALAPTSVEPLLNIARLSLRLARVDEAEVQARRLIEIDPSNANGLLMLARARTARKDNTGAIEAYSRILATDSTNRTALIELARAYRSVEHWDEAADAFGRFLVLVPDHPEATRSYGQMLVQAGRAGVALALWHDRHLADPTNVEPLIWLGRISTAAGDRTRAEIWFREAAKLEPDNDLVLLELAKHLANRETTQYEAVDTYRRLIALAPGNIDARLRLAAVLERLGRLEEAQHETLLATETAPTNYQALSRLAQIKARRKNWEGAHATLLELDRLVPDRLETKLRIGDTLRWLGRDDEAVRYYEDLVARNPLKTEAVIGLARARKQSGQINRSVEAWRIATVQDPFARASWLELVVLLATADREDEALAEFERARAALTPQPGGLLFLAQILDAARFDTLAPGAYEGAIAAMPQSSEAHQRFGDFWARLGILDKAVREFALARQLEPQSPTIGLSAAQSAQALESVGESPLSIVRGPARTEPVMVPERLFDWLARVAREEVDIYNPVPRSIIHVNQSLAPGGAERQLVNTLKGLADEPSVSQLALFCTSLNPRVNRDFYLSAIENTRIEIVLPDESKAWTTDPIVARYAQLIELFPQDMANIGFWLAEFRRRRPEVVHSWQDLTNLTVVVAAALAGVPKIVLGTRSMRPDNPRRRLRRYMQEAYRLVMELPTVCMVNNSRAGADDYADWIGIDPARIEVIYNGIDFDRMEAGADSERCRAHREALGIPLHAPILGGVYRMSEEKRGLLWVEVAARVASELPDAHFVICGDGPMREQILRHAQSLGIGSRLHLPGNVSDVANWYRMFNCVMLTSRHEGLPNVLMEAQSFGVPVVVPKVGGAPETVLDGVTGFAVPNADAENLSQSVIKTMTDSSWRDAARLRSRTFIREKFGVPAMVSRTLDLYGIGGPNG